ncbi:M28 family peptidase [Geobacter argillaceus]|uniref:Peptidase M28-like protein n=1 Tax=Geobacter argillaceus TaxID=345631 RepID=A0A562VG32_9BACT|nr:M28 family peptidase [Geobacter argillaceus]TWJ16869.1 peptidase M28-like protein [Geobacter argillaceus]
MAFSELVSIDRIRNHIRALEGVRHPVAAPGALARSADYITAHLISQGYEVANHLFPDNGHQFRNVIATRRCLGRHQERVILLAHYDTVATTPGADDNASGVAVMLEVATLLSQLRFERTIQFIGVSLEENEREDDPESGTRGSRALASHARANGWHIEGVVVLESVAFAGDRVVQTVPPGVPVPVPESGNFIAVVGNERSADLVDGFSRAVKRQGDGLPCVTLTVPGNGELLPDSRRSDHAPFWDEGYRAVMVTDTTNFRNPHYHRPTDTLETLNMEFAARVCSATAGLIAEMARPRS